MVGRRFTVITGGAEAPTPDPRSWRIDLCRPGQVTPESVAAWRALLTRTGAPDPVFADPDYLQAAAQHGAGGREVLFALVWAGEGAHRVLCGAVALTVPHPVWGKGRFTAWQPYGHAVAPALETRFAEAIHAALLDRLTALRRGATLDLGPDPREARGPAARGPVLAPVPDAVRIPAQNVVAVGGPGATVRERIVAPDRIRDAVEEFLAFDAAHAAAPIIGDPSEAALVRVVTRLFARRQQASVEFTRRNGGIVAATLGLGAGPHAVIWRRASEGMAARRRLDRSA